MKIELAQVDEYLSQHRSFCLLDWLLKNNIIPYHCYEAWRNGEHGSLEEAADLRRGLLESLAEQANKHCNNLKLDSEDQAYQSWGSEPKPLIISRDTVLQRALGCRWQRPQDAPQMDLFMDNAALIAENQVHQSIELRQFTQAQKNLTQLTELNPSHAKLGGLQDLIHYGLHMDAGDVPVEALEAELAGLRDEVRPLALEVLGVQSRDYLAHAWRRIANALDGQPYNKNNPDLHINYALLQIPDWRALQNCLEKTAELYSSPELMSRLAQAYFYNRESALSLLMWGLLVEFNPQKSEALIEKADFQLKNYWDDFLAFDDHWPNQYFLAYLMIRQPGLVAAMDKLPRRESLNREAVTQATAALVSARLEERDEKELRSSLKKISSAMLNCYMNKRDWYRRDK